MGMNGFPTCQKEIRIKFHVINALYNKGIESVTVKATGSSQGLLSEVTDAGGFATIGPFVPGESITVKVSNNGFDDVDRVFTADEAVTYMMLGLNPSPNRPFLAQVVADLPWYLMIVVL